MSYWHSSLTEVSELQEAIYYFNRGDHVPLKIYIDRHSNRCFHDAQCIWWEGGQFEEAVMTRGSNRAVVMVMKNGDIEIAFYKDESRIVDAIQIGNICSLLDDPLNE